VTALKTSNRPWTEEDEALLLEMLAVGKSKTLIAAKLRRSVKAVKSRAQFIRKAERRPDERRASRKANGR